MSDFSFQQSELAPGFILVAIAGKIKSDNVDRFEALFQDMLKTGNKQIILDLSGLEFLNSKAVGIILKTLGGLRKSGGDISVTGVNPQIFQVFQLLTLDKIMKFFGTVSEALSGLKPSS